MTSLHKNINNINLLIIKMLIMFLVLFFLNIQAIADVYLIKDKHGNVIRVTNQFQMLKKEKDAGYIITVLIESRKDKSQLSQFKRYNFKDNLDWEKYKTIASIIEGKIRNGTENELNYPVYQVLATAYTPDELCCAPYADGYTATGYPAGYGSVAIDPEYGLFQFGDILYIDGYGLGIADDVGSAIKGKHIDVCFNTGEIQKAYNWGRQNVRVWKIK